MADGGIRACLHAPALSKPRELLIDSREHLSRRRAAVTPTFGERWAPYELVAPHELSGERK